MDIIRTRQKNWIVHILRGNSLTAGDNGRKDGREERKRKGKTKAHGRWRTDTGNSRKRHNIKKSRVVGHLDLPGGGDHLKKKKLSHDHNKHYCI